MTTRTRAFRRVVACLTAVAAVAIPHVAEADIDDEPLRPTGPVTGTRYVVHHSCLSGSTMAGAYGNSDAHPRAVTWELDRRFGGATSTSTREFVNPHDDVFQPSLFTSSTGGQTTTEGSIVLRERWADEPDSAFREFATGDFACADYDEIAAVGASTFVPVPPRRVLDTRPRSQTGYSGSKPGARAVVDVPRSAFPNVPRDAIAASVTVTAVDANGPGHISVVPTGVEPGRTSNVNATHPGHTIANLAISPFGSDGISVYTHSGSHLLVDVNGYFVGASGPTSEGRLTSFDAVRVLDTRPRTRTGYSGSKPTAGQRITVGFDEFAAIRNGRAGAVAVNITATESDAAGHVEAAAAGALVPGTASVLNLTGSGQTVAGMAIVPVNADGEIELLTFDGAHLIVDIVGWFSNQSAASSTSGQFVPLAPERLLDTRYSSPINCCAWTGPSAHDPTTTYFNPGATTFVGLKGLDDVGSAVFVNLTAVHQLGPGYFQLGPGDAFEPGTSSNVNFTQAGQVVANAAISQRGERGDIHDGLGVFMSSGGNAIIDVAGFFTD